MNESHVVLKPSAKRDYRNTVCKHCGVKFHPNELNRHLRNVEVAKLSEVASNLSDARDLPDGLLHELKDAARGRSPEARIQRQRIVAQLARGVDVRNLRF